MEPFFYAILLDFGRARVVLSLLAHGVLRSPIENVSVRSLRGMTGAQAAASVLVYYGKTCTD
jgi:hypothetical protein